MFFSCTYLMKSKLNQFLIKEMNDSFFLRKEIIRPPELWVTIKSEVFICMCAIRHCYNAGKTGGAFNIEFLEISPSQKDEKSAFFLSLFSFIICECLCVTSTLHLYIVYMVGAWRHLNERKDIFEQVLLSFLLRPPSSSSACCLLISLFICLFIQHLFFLG